MDSKIKSPQKLSRLLSRLRKKRKKIVFTNGCFDLLHVGHIRYLRRARALGDLLVIGLNTDKSVRALKGSGRPLTAQGDRAEILSALACVDFVTFFPEKTPERLIRALRPDILVKGGDWKKERIAGGRFVESYGGKVRSLPFIPGRSTTGLLDKIKKF
ncbi:MAG: D-glycero-beta-D-manno-heptose 1-phosphate adenylyltransferase [Candidatus Omnitrophica bacterium]|nr:D-glycero-beta-D-manno-heptose 1-phosphate adenylyltransferase [Candidatus Omnitrophota bacterium]